MAKAETKKKPNFFKRIIAYFKDLKSEIKKVVWPTKQATLRNTIVVLVTIGVLGLFIVLLDLGFTSLLGLLLGNA